MSQLPSDGCTCLGQTPTSCRKLGSVLVEPVLGTSLEMITTSAPVALADGVATGRCAWTSAQATMHAAAAVAWPGSAAHPHNWSSTLVTITTSGTASRTVITSWSPRGTHLASAFVEPPNLVLRNESKEAVDQSRPHDANPPLLIPPVIVPCDHNSECEIGLTMQTCLPLPICQRSAKTSATFERVHSTR